MSTTQEKLATLNALREAAGQKPLARWSKKVSLLDDAIQAARQAEHDQIVAANLKDEQPQPQGKKLTVAYVCRDGFAKGHSNEVIHGHLMDFAAQGIIRYDESKKWYVTWYRSAEKRRAAKAAA